MLDAKAQTCVDPTEVAAKRHGHSSDSLPRHYYSVYGLTVASSLVLPELLQASATAAPDLEIENGHITPLCDHEGKEPWVSASNAITQLYFNDIVRLRIEHGQRIIVESLHAEDSQQEAESRDIRLFLLGGGLGAALYQRSWLPLHLSAVKTTAGVWGFTGRSGAGKSTLAAWLHYHHGWPLVSDDVAVIRPEENDPVLYPGPPRLKLWKDALKALGLSTHGLEPDRTRLDKYQLSHHQGFQASKQSLHALVVLEDVPHNETASIERITGLDAFQAVIATLYRPELGHLGDTPARLLQDVSALAARLRVYRFRRPRSLTEMAHHLEPLTRRIQQEAEDAH
ncbi:Hpr(Ser) kinase/phosphatase [Franzmannia pantelleriensis]|uniref:Hpr(Ser) kinase/phosphatase n=1 Tax=Franzmannia pantelleriensis TaxID=48727 RepID=A0A1G9EUF1_9GAMM|nr:hypothetical protein [Halomonas pantelleriensis]SDK79792.1 Hpr(Ser) kinase/phosphatase [Halomonas pantelleriensis]